MKKQILIVEDEFIVANDLSKILTDAGFEVTGIADSFEQALRLIEKKRPSICLLDIRLKGEKTGIDLAKHLQGLGIPFIFLSANSSKAIFEEAKATKPYGFLVKPFRNKDVILALETAIHHISSI
jgi:formate hydrogenlyase transcriptional activator